MKSVEISYELTNGNYYLKAIKPDGEPWRQPKMRVTMKKFEEVMKSKGWMQSGPKVWVKPDNDAQRLEILCQRHDWLYLMSDDHGVYLNGEFQASEIKRVAAKVQGAEHIIQRYLSKFGGGTNTLSKYI